MRDEKTKIEKQLYDTEFVIGEKSKELETTRDTNLKERQLSEEKVKDLEDKVKWFRQN